MAITVHEKISESATTAVFRAYDDTLHRDVLLKVLHRHLAHDGQVRERFVREARACAALRSEYIVQVYDLREHEGSPAIVMEFVIGRSLKDVIAEGKFRNPAFAQTVAVHVLRGLAVAHAQGIIHRDIKPGNILVSAGGTMKLTDFGLAQVAVAPALTSEGMIVGTPAYLAPEIILGQQADARSDLFSLGATIVETLTGERLFEGTTYNECLARIAQFTADRLDRLAAASSPEFVAFLKRLMDPDRDRRYGSPKEALAALVKSGSSQFARPPRSALPAKRRPAFRRMVAVSAILVAVSLIILVRFHGSLFNPFRGTGPEAPGPARADPVQPVDSLNRDSSAIHHADRPTDERPPDLKKKQVLKLPAKSPGSLVIAGSAGAKVMVDNRIVGDLPLASSVPVSEGTHTAVFTLPPFEPIVRTFEVEPGKEIRVTADFLANAGYLRCLVTPWADIYIDDLYRETTPFDRPIPVSAGTRRVKFHHPSLGDSVLRVTIAPQETLDLRLTYQP